MHAGATVLLSYVCNINFYILYQLYITPVKYCFLLSRVIPVMFKYVYF